MKQIVTPIDFDKLSDDIYWLGNKLVLRLNVNLARQNEKDNTRIFHHKEYIYASKYSDKDRVGTLRRSFNYYLTIDKIDEYGSGVMIRVQDIILIRTKLSKSVEWFTNGTFAQKNNELIIPSRPESIIISGLANGKYITLDPIVIQYEDSNIMQQGIRLTLSDSGIYADLSIDRFYGFYYLMNTINLFQSAQLLVNYLGRPELGVNICEFTNGDFIEQEPPEMIAKNRTIRNRKNKSFFDIDDL